jgi:8-oxo-dGTP pyrophosphatase MutT (NUDIX family)
MHTETSQPPLPELVATSTTVVYTNRWMTVREDKTLRHDGAEGIYGLVEKPDFALVIPYADGGFHLVEQYRYAVKGRYWEFPQGSWEDKPDADPLALARGELAEETGLTAGAMTHWATCSRHTDTATRASTFFSQRTSPPAKPTSTRQRRA